MLCIISENTDPYFNAAAEEHLFRKSNEDCFILYRNIPSTIVGKHQNTLAEINYDFVQKNDIKVVRRLSGGGTVYHDLGNLNFTFIQTGEAGKLVDFIKFTKPILEVLNSMAVPARFEGVNDLRVGDKKISGNAEHVFKNRVLHHGTLLFSSDLKMLSQTLKIRPEVYQDKAVKSIRSVVSNISDFLEEEVSIIQFRDMILEHILKSFPVAKIQELNKEDNQSIQKLVKEKYSTWKWNFGYSPKYQFQQDISLGEKIITVKLEVERGIIKEISVKDKKSGEPLNVVEEKLRGLYHRSEDIRKELLTVDTSSFLPGIDKINLIKGLF